MLSYSVGYWILSAIHFDIGTVTELPIKRHLALDLATDSDGRVQSTSKPCNLSASFMFGVKTLPVGESIAGGEGIL